MSPDTMTRDVAPADARNLRRRLQATGPLFTTAILPGGAIVEDGPNGLSYHFHVQGNWSIDQTGADLLLTTDTGHTLSSRDGRIQLTLSK